MKRTPKIIIRQVILFLAVSLVFVNDGFSQKEELIIKLDNPGEPGSLTFENPKGSVSIEGYDGDYVLISAEVRNKIGASTNVPEGMSIISQRKIEMKAETRANNIKLSSESDLTVDFSIKVPRQFSLKISSLDNGVIEVIRINGAIEIENKNGAVDLRNINGSCIVSSVYGRITADVRSLLTGETIMLTSYEGDVELRLADDQHASFLLKSTYGDILSDLNMEIKDETVKVSENMGTRVYKMDAWTRGQINGGGNNIIISSYSGNLFIRQSESKL